MLVIKSNFENVNQFDTYFDKLQNKSHSVFFNIFKNSVRKMDKTY
jgi:hypothetical protein